ncbi:MAG TPA: hypothetical protein VFU88_12845 [Ktedonobacterales bacterium]|nr:hypothetical protein [Ktedonobacterales bacterium]
MHPDSTNPYTPPHRFIRNLDSRGQHRGRLTRLRASLKSLRSLGMRPALAAATSGGFPDALAAHGSAAGEQRARPLSGAARRWRGWLQAATARRQAPIPGAPASWFRGLRKWSPGVVPPLLALMLLGGMVLASRQQSRAGGLIPPSAAPILFLIYFVFGGLYGVGLYIAPTTRWWLAVLSGGVLIYAAATLWVLAGPLAVATAGVLLAAIVAWYVRHHTQTVAQGTVLVTTLAGGYFRTISPGMTVLLPGERVRAAVETTDRQFACPAQRARLTGPDGSDYIARAAATVAFHTTAQSAHLAVLTSDAWERDLHERANQTLREALTEWGHRVLAEDDVPERFLARTVLHELREHARPNGIAILWISVRDIWLTPEDEVIPVAEWEASDAADAEAGGNTASPVTSAGHPASAAQGHASDTQPNVQQPRAGGLPPIADARAESDAQAKDELPPEALADAYEAVRDEHITDPATVREIARAFLRVAADPELDEDFPYDAAAAAQILMDRAASLEHHATHGGP